MKKYIITVIMAVSQIVAVAQTVNVHFKNGQTIEYPSANVDYVDFSAKPSEPTLTPGQVVDLGLSVYWASCNLGANNPEEYGNYYAWGETSPKSGYYASNYAFYNSSTDNYIGIGNNISGTEYDISGTEYDAATVNIGNDWRMPTRDQMNELLYNCTWEWSQINGHNGYKITGANGNSIFIPSTGSKIQSVTLHLGEKTGFAIWSATTYSPDGPFAITLNSFSNTPKVDTISGTKHNGICIRPVTTNPNASR